MHALAIAVALSVLAVDAPYASSTSTDTNGDASGATSTALKKEPSTLGRVGIGLLAGGAALAATTAAGATLLEAVTTPDDNRNKPQHPEYTEVAGFVTVAVGSLAAGLVIVGGAIVLEDAVSAPSPTTNASTNAQPNATTPAH